NHALAQGPQESLEPLLPNVFTFHIRERTRDTLIGVVHRAVDRRSVLRHEAIFLVPDVDRRFLIRNAVDVHGLNFDCVCIHAGLQLRICWWAYPDTPPDEGTCESPFDSPPD